jgi:hypothetical protein
MGIKIPRKSRTRCDRILTGWLSASKSHYRRQLKARESPPSARRDRARPTRLGQDGHDAPEHPQHRRSDLESRRRDLRVPALFGHRGRSRAQSATTWPRARRTLSTRKASGWPGSAAPRSPWTPSGRNGISGQWCTSRWAHYAGATGIPSPDPAMGATLALLEP